MRKAEARAAGLTTPKKVETVGKRIGGDRYYDDLGHLPKKPGRERYEADVKMNTRCAPYPCLSIGSRCGMSAANFLLSMDGMFRAA